MAVSAARRAATLTALWRVLRDARRPGSPGLADRLRATPRLVRSVLRGRYQGLSRGRLGLLAVAAAYVISPVDVVPESLFLLLGLADDVAVAGWLASTLLVETDRFLAWEQGRPAPADDPRVVPGEVVDGQSG